jgi:hypothetical protein
MKMELTGKAIVFDSEENAQLWFKTISEVETQKEYESVVREAERNFECWKEYEQAETVNLKFNKDGELKQKSIIMICCNCGARTKVNDIKWRQCPRCKQSRTNFLMK